MCSGGRLHDNGRNHKNGRIYYGDDGRKRVALTTLMQEGIAAVGRKTGRSASTVRKYIKMKDCPALVRHTTKELIRMV